ncbi:MAG: long-chain-acyl-CoA synthetase [Deltaproteobacteria bacterium]|nr:long-chain-acyl-CoA synthetase [Deltaproteobacteria bacterium]
MAVSREATWNELARLSAGTLQHTPDQRYTVADRLEERAAAHPERSFVRYASRDFSYGALNALANRTAEGARAIGLRRGDVVALVMENRPEFLATWMGLAKLGVTTALVGTQLRGPSLRHALDTARPRVIVAGSECAEALASLAAAIPAPVWMATDPDAESRATTTPPAQRWDDLLARATDENPDPALREGLRAGDDLFHLFTSGTTGLPKAARLSHMRWLGVGDGMSAIAGYGPEDVLACVLPLYHGAGGMVVVSCALSQGASLWLARRFSASRFWSEVRERGVTAFQYVGEICRYLANQPPGPADRDHRLRTMMGAGLGADVWRVFADRFGVERILEGWSSTEANTSLINLDGVVGSCGRIPYPERHNGRLIRFDPETETHPRGESGFCIECAPGETGEFIGRILDLPGSGAGRFEGYTDPEATERKILRDVFERGDRWYRSGDLLRRDADDYFYFVDRIGDTYRWKSENVSTQEVAEALAGFPGVEIANVYGVHVPGTEGRAGMAALVMAEDRGFDGRAFFDWTQQRLAPWAAPVFVRLVRAPDMTATFKLRKLTLRAEGYDLACVRDPLYVRDETACAYVPLTRASQARLGIRPFACE